MKLFASDYDGTYWKLTKKGPIDLRKNIKITKKWRAEGNLFVFATGRSISMMKIEQKIHGIVYDYLVGLNGGVIVSRSGEILFHQSIDEAVARKIITLIQKEDVLQYAVTDGICGHYQTMFDLTHKTFYLFALLKLFLKEYNLTLEQALKRPVVQISVKMKSHQQAITFAKRINEQFKDQVVAYSNLQYVDITVKGLSKATGVEYVARFHEIKAEHVYCMGDSFNDVPMFEAYHGFTLPEAHAEIKDQVEAVFETVGEAMLFILNHQSKS